MRTLPTDEIDHLRHQHEQANRGEIHASGLIRKGYEVRDSTEPQGRRLLTEDELKLILTAPPQ